ncbi:hypothetical protein PV328_006635 [Microctonus aethiopoides]|uniref:LisH domain-containing protein n=1 Tax=Microctonus aethiopoides TaxID=144406 RepID=A0AA39KTW1_9HYME|nr:hypothetical protein PV328_006635 [Microctonus aethiopoides]
MDEQLMYKIQDKVHHVVGTTPVNNSKPSHLVQMVDRSTCDNFFNTTSMKKENFELQINTNDHKTNQSKPFELIPNDRDIPDFLGQSDDEECHILNESYTFSTCTRSTQTNANDFNEPKILQTCGFNYPTMILNNGGSSRKISTPNQFYREMMMARSQLNSVYHNYQTLKTRYHQLYADYHKLMGIAAELTASLENSARGEPVDIRTTMQTCMKIYPDLFNQNVRDNDKVKSSMAESKVDYLDKNLKISMLSTVPLSAKDLNYKKIKLHLINGNVRTKLLLLQALRWKITLSQPGERDETIIEYIHSDLLGLYGQIAGDSGKSILPYILMPLDVVWPHPIQQSAARLLNTFASFKCGRDYLAVGPNILNVVIQCLDSTHAESIDAFTCDMIIATLQKLSLRKHQRLFMISAGMIEWLIHHLKAESHSMGTYRLEYATALLMNLSLHKEAQIKAAVIAPMLLSTLIALLSLEHLPALPYVYGALNNFLANSTINEEASIIGLKSILEYHRNYRTGELRHLNYILSRHKQKHDHIIEKNMNEDDDHEENDVVEDELDEMDPVKIQAGDLFGEALLTTCYSLSPFVMPIDKNEFTMCSSLDTSHKVGDELNVGRNEEDKLLKNYYSVYHSQKLSPRLTPIHNKSNLQNPVELNTLTRFNIENKLNDYNIETIVVDEDKNKFTLPEMRHTANEISTDTASIMMIRQLYFACSPDKNYKEKVINSFNMSKMKSETISPMKSVKNNESATNSWTLWDINLNKTDNSINHPKVSHSRQYLFHELKSLDESAKYIYQNEKSEESSVTTLNSGINMAPTVIDSACEDAEIVEARISSIASL